MFQDPLFLLVILAAFVVVIILMVGIGAFAKGGAFHDRHANRLMRWRIIAQAVAVILILIFAVLHGRPI